MKKKSTNTCSFHCIAGIGYLKPISILTYTYVLRENFFII